MHLLRREDQMPHCYTGEKMLPCLAGRHGDWVWTGASPSLPASTTLPRRTLAFLCLCRPGIPCPLSSLCSPDPGPHPHPLPCSRRNNNKLERTRWRQPCSNSLSASKEIPQFDTKVPSTSSSPARHPLEEGKDKAGYPASAAPLFRTTVFISMVTSELPATAFLCTLVMEFPFDRSGLVTTKTDVVKEKNTQ